ncbi:DUF2627 domain-containing protein [Salsuginibacillus kocurii]|uniref:DUF2627 domain-containing protein n=1 Tax=Salsuginibacillus kocurii TaxID=427078 RepID=UPI00035CB651|nr:DUF2627 domain-containing protein [Salsuginibacillus kocurii]
MRLIALIILLTPIFFAGLGIKWMRDALFGILQNPLPSLTLQFILGMVLLIGGIGFIGGFIVHRDRKNGKIPPRQNKKQTAPTSPN